MRVYIVLVIIEEEYCGKEIEKVFTNKEDAENYVKENQSTFIHWDGNKIEYYSIEEWEVE